MFLCDRHIEWRRMFRRVILSESSTHSVIVIIRIVVVITVTHFVINISRGSGSESAAEAADKVRLASSSGVYDIVVMVFTVTVCAILEVRVESQCV